MGFPSSRTIAYSGGKRMDSCERPCYPRTPSESARVVVL
jgi:hypothetical protein